MTDTYFVNPAPLYYKVVLGFPSNIEGEIIDIKVFVDDKPVSSIREDVQKAQRYGREFPRYFWKLWKMTFKANGYTRVLITYKVKPYENYKENLTVYDGYSSTKNFFKRWRKYPAGKKYIKNFQSYKTGYILQTGALWNKKINKAVIWVAHNTRKSSVFRKINPNKDYTITPDELIWTFTDLEPYGEKYDIKIIYNPLISNNKEINLLKNLINENPTDKQTYWLIARIYETYKDIDNTVKYYIKQIKMANKNKYKDKSDDPRQYTYFYLLKTLKEQEKNKKFKKYKKKAFKYFLNLCMSQKDENKTSCREKVQKKFDDELK